MSLGLQDKGLEYALTAFKNGATQVRLYGEYPPPSGSPVPAYTDYADISSNWNNPTEVSNVWKLTTINATVFEITDAKIQSLNGGPFTVIGIEIADSSNNLLLKKDFTSDDAPYVFSQRTVFNLESITVSAVVTDSIVTFV